MSTFLEDPEASPGLLASTVNEMISSESQRDQSVLKLLDLLSGSITSQRVSQADMAVRALFPYGAMAHCGEALRSLESNLPWTKLI